MKKRIASLLMAIVMLASLGVGSLAATTEKTLVQGNNTGLSAANFKDLADNSKPDGRHWAWDAIDHVVKFGLFNGTSATTFAPQNGMTRAQFVVVVTRLENTSRTGNNKLNVERVPTKTRFTDVPEDMWCAGAVAWAEANGIVEGYSDNTFKPNQVISRAQIAAFVYRYVNNYKKYTLKAVKPEPAQFTDFVDVHQVFQSAVNYCRTHGLIQGYGDHSLKPNIAVTRAQVAAILSRIIIILTTNRGGGGGGGGGGAASGFVNTASLAAGAWGNLTDYPWGVKYIAVNENGQAAPALTTGADLNDNNNTSNFYMQHGDMAVIAKEKLKPQGFTLTPHAAQNYALTGVYVYETVPPTDVNDRANAGNYITNLLKEDEDYTVDNGVVKMDVEKFDGYKRVTVVAQFGKPKTQPTYFRFIAVEGDDWDNITVNSSTHAKADLIINHIETLSSGTGTATQTSVMDDVFMMFSVDSGYEIPKPSNDIRVYDTTNLSGYYSSSWESKRMNGLYGLSANIEGENIISINGYDLKLSDNDPDGLKEVTVVVRVAQSVYGYDIGLTTSVKGMPLDVATYNSYSSTKVKDHLLDGSAPLKEALRLLYNDDGTAIDPAAASLMGLGSNAVSPNNNAYLVDYFIGNAIDQAVQTIRAGEPFDLKASAPQDMLEGMIAETIAGEINKNLDSTVRTQATANLAGELSTQYTALFNAVSTQLQAQGFTVVGNSFVDQNGSAITPQMWVNNTVNSMVVNAEQVTKDDVNIASLSGITANLIPGMSGYNVTLTPEFKNLQNMSVTVSLKGTYTVNGINTGTLYVQVSTPTAGVTRQPVPMISGYNGSSIALSKTGSISGQGSVPSEVLASVSGSNFKFDKDQLQGILDQVVGGKLDQMKKDLISNVQTATTGTDSKKALAVNESLNKNIISLLQVENYVTVNEDATIKVVPGLNSKTDSAKYRGIIEQYYDGFWNFHADLFQAYPEDGDASAREDVLKAVLDWFLSQAGKSNSAKGAKAESAAELLAKDRQPTVAQLFNYLYKNSGSQVSHPKATTVTVDMAQRSKSPTVQLTGKFSILKYVAGGANQMTVPVTFTVYRFDLNKLP